MSDFKHHRFEGEIVLWPARWYCRYTIGYRDLAQMTGERGVQGDHSTAFRWVRTYTPEIEKRLRWGWRRPRSTSWRRDETGVKVCGKWVCLYRAVDKRGDTVAFCRSPTQGIKAAACFLGRGPKGLKNWESPHVINTDKAPTYAAAPATLKKKAKCPDETVHPQVKYLNTIVEADHGKLKLLIRPVGGFKTPKTTAATIKAFEVMRALRRGRARIFNITHDIRGEARIVERAFRTGPAAPTEVVRHVDQHLGLKAA